MASDVFGLTGEIEIHSHEKGHVENNMPVNTRKTCVLCAEVVVS